MNLGSDANESNRVPLVQFVWLTNRWWIKPPPPPLPILLMLSLDMIKIIILKLTNTNWTYETPIWNKATNVIILFKLLYTPMFDNYLKQHWRPLERCSYWYMCIIVQHRWSLLQWNDKSWRLRTRTASIVVVVVVVVTDVIIAVSRMEWTSRQSSSIGFGTSVIINQIK